MRRLSGTHSMVGCRHNAKNTLVKNYLYLAEPGRRGRAPAGHAGIAILRTPVGRREQTRSQSAGSASCAGNASTTS
jgi:hypothetical protein